VPQKHAFSLPVLRPLLPTADKIFPYLQAIDEVRWYTNAGPRLEQFERRLAGHFGVDASEIVTSGNATLAIAQSLRAVGAPPGSVCVMPSWTFVATAAAAIWAGLEPHFVDVDRGSWAIRPEDILDVAAKRSVGAAVVVSAFGAPLDVDAWHEFSRTSGIPVVVDAAAGFDAFRLNRLGHNGLPIVVSLHATKVFGVGEGSVVIVRDAALAKKIRAFGNFGFAESRNAYLQGVNAKMSEYTAAVGLAHLDQWPESRERWDALTSAFVDEVNRMPQLRLAPAFGDGWVSSFGLVELPPTISATAVADLLAQRGVETRRWWGEGCHRQTAYQHYEHSSLPRTEYLSRQVLGLPFWLGLGRQDVRLLFQALDDALREAEVRRCPGRC
jgi:dTDP-4-amino-4,6-dideoxygalactose transaminase